MKAVVFFSGGIMSWGAAKRTADKYGKDNTTLLFTDTKIESPGLYSFIDEAAKNIGSRLIKISEGRTPFEVFNDVKMLGNSRVDPCSRILKREPGERWIKENCDPLNTVLVFGLDWTETHRYDDGGGRGVKPRYAKLGWPNVEAPMIDPPYMDRKDMIAWASREGLTISRSYSDGFAHDNCGGGCVKAGQGHFAHLLRMRPDVFAKWENEEQEFNRRRPGKRFQTFLKGISLRELRKKIQSGGQVDMFSIGGCGCFVGNE